MSEKELKVWESQVDSATDPLTRITVLANMYRSLGTPYDQRDYDKADVTTRRLAKIAMETIKQCEELDTQGTAPGDDLSLVTEIFDSHLTLKVISLCESNNKYRTQSLSAC